MALVLTIRAIDGPIHIGDDIELELVSISGGQAKLAFTAPDDVIIHRDIVYQRIKNENRGNQ